jgi:hypothetical protein
LACNLHTLQSIHSHLHTLQSIHSSTLSDKIRVFGELTSMCRRQRLLCACGREAAVVAEEEAGSSGVDGCGGDWHKWHRQRQRRLAE